MDNSSSMKDGDLREEGERVGPHHLPDEGQRQVLVTLHDVRTFKLKS